MDLTHEDAGRHAARKLVTNVHMSTTLNNAKGALNEFLSRNRFGDRANVKPLSYATKLMLVMQRKGILADYLPQSLNNSGLDELLNTEPGRKRLKRGMLSQLDADHYVAPHESPADSRVRSAL